MGFHIELPADLNATDFDLKMMFASKLFQEGFVTSGQRAQMVGISRRSFIGCWGNTEWLRFRWRRMIC